MRSCNWTRGKGMGTKFGDINQRKMKQNRERVK